MFFTSPVAAILARKQLPADVTVVRANMLFVENNGLPPAMLTRQGFALISLRDMEAGSQESEARMAAA